MAKGVIYGIIGGLAILLIAGCSTKTPQALESAMQSYNKVSNDKKIKEYAPVALYETQQSLEKAKKAAEQDNEQELEHLAYITEQRAAIAQALAEGGEAKSRIDRLAEQREQIRLQVRQTQAERAEHKAQEAQSKAERLQEELAQAQAQVKETARGIVLTLGDVLFEFDKAALLPGARHNLEPLAEFLREHAKRQLIIEGHTDNVGSSEYNEKLSLRRAQAVREYLIGHGIDRNRMTTAGYGERYPVASNNSEAGRQQNRRVNVVILKEGENPQQHLREGALLRKGR